MLTEVARSIMAASLPISQGPKLSPRSQFRSIVMMSCPLLWIDVDLVLNLSLPRPRVEGVDRRARDVGILQRLDIKHDILRVVNAVGQGAQQLGEFPCLGLRRGHADRLEPERATRRCLCKPPKIGRGH